MQSKEVSWVCLFLFLCGVASGLNECGEFNSRSVRSQASNSEFESMLYHSKLAEFFNAVENNDTGRLNEIFSFVEDLVKETTATKNSIFPNALLKFVVRFCIKFYEIKF